MAIIDNTKKVYQGQPGTASGTLYTAAGNGELIKEIRICNTTASNAWIDLYVVSSGGTAGASNIIMSNKVIPPNDYLVDASTIDMAVGDFIVGLQQTSGALTVTITNYQK